MYNRFAKVYDLFMQHMPYDEWCDYIIKIWTKFGASPKLVLDLACGTGNITTRLSKAGYDMIGIDISEEMLMSAKEKSLECQNDILYLCQDMCSFELYGTVDAIVCICDSINYLLEDSQLNDLFKLVKNYLNPGGIFIFDINSEHKLKNILSDNSFSETYENAAYILENYYSEDERINEYHATFFVKDDAGLYERFEEFHYERAYAADEISDSIKRSGLSIIGVYDELPFNPVTADTERIFFVVRKQ